MGNIIAGWILGICSAALSFSCLVQTKRRQVPPRRRMRIWRRSLSIWTSSSTLQTSRLATRTTSPHSSARRVWPTRMWASRATRTCPPVHSSTTRRSSAPCRRSTSSAANSAFTTRALLPLWPLRFVSYSAIASFDSRNLSAKVRRERCSSYIAMNILLNS